MPYMVTLDCLAAEGPLLDYALSFVISDVLFQRYCYMTVKLSSSDGHLTMLE